MLTSGNEEEDEALGVIVEAAKGRSSRCLPKRLVISAPMDWVNMARIWRHMEKTRRMTMKPATATGPRRRWMTMRGAW